MGSRRNRKQTDAANVAQLETPMSDQNDGGASIPTGTPPQASAPAAPTDPNAPVNTTDVQGRLERLERRVEELESQLGEANEALRGAGAAFEELTRRLDAGERFDRAASRGGDRELTYVRFRNPTPDTVRFECHDYGGALRKHVVAPNDTAKVPAGYARHVKGLAPQLVLEE